MSQPPIARSHLTTVVLEHLQATVPARICVFGRGLAPQAGGWTEGQPGRNTFQAYCVLKTAETTGWTPEAVGRPRSGAQVGYATTTVGATEEHADDVADLVRAALVELPETYTLRASTWSLQKVEFPRLGPVTRNSSVDPPYWETTDAVSLLLTRSRAT